MISLPLLSLIAGSVLMTLVGLYVGWRSLRVYLLRLDLLIIRNDLWDAAHAEDCFTNSDYLSCRNSINLLIRYAHRIDVVTLALTFDKGVETEKRFNEATPEAMRKAIETATNRAGLRMSHYVTWHRPFTGILLFRFVSLMGVTYRLTNSLRSMPSNVLKSSVVRIRNFSRQPDQSSIAWFNSNGPACAFASLVNDAVDLI